MLDQKTDHICDMESYVGWVIFCVHWTRQQGDGLFRQTSFGVSVRVSLDELKLKSE